MKKFAGFAIAATLLSVLVFLRWPTAEEREVALINRLLDLTGAVATAEADSNPESIIDEWVFHHEDLIRLEIASPQSWEAHHLRLHEVRLAYHLRALGEANNAFFAARPDEVSEAVEDARKCGANFGEAIKLASLTNDQLVICVSRLMSYMANPLDNDERLESLFTALAPPPLAPAPTVGK